MTARRILIASEPMEYGVLSYIERLCDGLDRSRWEPALAFSPRRMAPQAHALLARLVARGIRVRTLHFHRGLGPGDVRAAAGLVDEMRAFRPDVLHLHSTKAGLVGRVAGRLLGIPTLYTPHGTSWHYTGRMVGRLQLAVERGLRRATTTLVSVCAEEAAAFIAEVGFEPGRVRVIRNGVRLPDASAVRRLRVAQRAALNVGASEVWLAFVGRLTREKGADVLLRVLGEHTGAHGLLVVGDGPERSALEAQAARTTVPVRFCGYQSDVSPFLAAADVFVQPSRSEGLPFALLEAMAYGVPAVCSRVGGIAAAVDGGGIVVPPDDPAALGAALRALCRDGERRRLLGECGRTRVAAAFGEGAMLAAIHAAYEAACERRTTPATADVVPTGVPVHGE